MNSKIEIDVIWWRNVQVGEFYNIERHHQLEGGGGSLYIEIPSSMVPETLEFLDATGQDVDNMDAISIHAYARRDPKKDGYIEFRKKKGNRMRIARQNRQAPSSQRHPAWTAEFGFPKAPDHVKNSSEARPFFPTGGLRIYLAKTKDGIFYADFTEGDRPSGMTPSNPMWSLYPSSTRTPVGGVIK